MPLDLHLGTIPDTDKVGAWTFVGVTRVAYLQISRSQQPVIEPTTVNAAAAAAAASYSTAAANRLRLVRHVPRQ